MFTVRNVFNSYKSQLLSYYVFEQVISSKTTLHICDIFLMKNSMVFYEYIKYKLTTWTIFKLKLTFLNNLNKSVQRTDISPRKFNAYVSNRTDMCKCTLTFYCLVWPWPLRYESRSLHIGSMRTTCGTSYMVIHQCVSKL